MSEQKKTKAEIERELAKDAVLLQNACNFIAIVHTFDKMATKLFEAGVTSSELRKHPIMLIMLDKLNSLADIQSCNSVILDAHAKCEQLANE